MKYAEKAGYHMVLHEKVLKDIKRFKKDLKSI